MVLRCFSAELIRGGSHGRFFAGLGSKRTPHEKCGGIDSICNDICCFQWRLVAKDCDRKKCRGHLNNENIRFKLKAFSYIFR
jgi:hypothetical protein